MATPRRPSDDELAELIRVESRQVLATLIRFLGDIDQAEEALHDAVVAATDAWRRDGAPDRPGAWLSTVARNKALDHVRREARRADREAAAVALRGPVDDTDTATDPLRLLFTCCHPALAPEAQMALALRTLCGLTTVEIARVFLVPDGTIGQRITRAKAKIARARIPYRVPSDDELPDRLRPVLATIAAMFTVGHHPPAGPLDGRVDLADDAVRLGRLLVALMPDDPEAAGLLALMLAQHARRATRLDEHGDAVLLADQDRSRWDRGMIAEAAALVESSLRRGRVARSNSRRRSGASTTWRPRGTRPTGPRSPSSIACSSNASRPRSCGSTGPSPKPRRTDLATASGSSPISTRRPSNVGTCTGRRSPTSTADSTNRPRREPPTGERSPARATTPTAASSNAGWGNSRTPSASLPYALR